MPSRIAGVRTDPLWRSEGVTWRPFQAEGEDKWTLHILHASEYETSATLIHCSGPAHLDRRVAYSVVMRLTA